MKLRKRIQRVKYRPIRIVGALTIASLANIGEVYVEIRKRPGKPDVNTIWSKRT